MEDRKLEEKYEKLEGKKLEELITGGLKHYKLPTDPVRCFNVFLENRPAFGKSFLYPVNDTAKKLCELLKQTTLMRKDIVTLIELGYDIYVRPNKAIRQ